MLSNALLIIAVTFSLVVLSPKSKESQELFITERAFLTALTYWSLTNPLMFCSELSSVIILTNNSSINFFLSSFVSVSKSSVKASFRLL